MSSYMEKTLDQVLLVVFLLTSWQILYLIVGSSGLSSPVQTAIALVGLLQQDWFWQDILETLRAMVASAILAALLGLAIGIPLGLNRLAGDVFEPVLATFYSIPKVTLYPIVLLFFGLGISARIAFGVIHGFIPIVLLSMTAIQNIRPSLLRTAKVMQLSHRQTILRVVMPAALPAMLTGLRIGISTSFLGVIIGEMFASKQGLGFRLMNSIANNDVPMIVSVALLLSLFAIGVNYALLIVCRRSAHAALN
jgi:NitT/TauT family transport system permease protein